MTQASRDNAIQAAIEHQRAGRLAEAEEIYRRLLLEKPEHPDVLHLLGAICVQSDRMEEGAELFRRAVLINPESAEYRKNLSAACRRLGQVDEAITESMRAIELKPDFAEAFNNLAGALGDAGRWGEAAAALMRALAVRPDYAEAHFNLAMQLLIHGDFERGWKEYEWRTRMASAAPAREFWRPPWDGRDPSGKTILLWCEQGLGDAIQFIRYARPLIERGAKVVVECPIPLVRLFRQSLEGVEVAAIGQPLPPFDVHYPLLSLPMALGTTLGTIPGRASYIAASPEQEKARAGRFDKSRQFLRVGLVWAGRGTHLNDRNRSIRLDQLARLRKVAGVSFYSLQKGPAGAQAAEGAFAGELIDWTAELEDFADTAALVANLDLVISVDTAVAHLAGAMGKPVWLLLPTPPDWRWMLKRQDSPWYPTMRMFRRKSAEDWGPVIDDVAKELAKLDTGQRRAPAV
jgi:Flp pilus assembly protein TadD